MSETTAIQKYALIIEDHPAWIGVLSSVIAKVSPELEIIGAKDVNSAKQCLQEYQERLELVSIDLGLPVKAGETRTPASNGIDLLRDLLKKQPNLNLAVSTGQDPKILSGLKSNILEHQGGFVFIHKGLTKPLMFEKFIIAKSGNLDRQGIESELGEFQMKPKWLEAIRLAAEGYNDGEISRIMRPKDEYHKNHDKTVDNHLRNAGRVLGLFDDNTELLSFRIEESEDGKLIRVPIEGKSDLKDKSKEKEGEFRVKLINAARAASLIE
jgi:hypothetical protein